MRRVAGDIVYMVQQFYVLWDNVIVLRARKLVENWTFVENLVMATRSRGRSEYHCQ